MLIRKRRRLSYVLATAAVSTASVWQTFPALGADPAAPGTQSISPKSVLIKSVDGGALAAKQGAASGAVPVKPAVTKAMLTLAQSLLDARQGKKGVTTIDSQLRMVMSFPHLVDQKPAAITKEPAYLGKPRYGAFTIGNGSKSSTYFAVDILGNGAIGKIYIDLNQNGDLTDDGSADWDDNYVIKGVMHHAKTVTVHASWGSAVQEAESGEYTISVNSCDGLKDLGYTSSTARAGSIKLGDKLYPIVLGEGGNDGIYCVPADGERSRQYEVVYIDIDGAVPADGPAPTIDPTNKHTFKAFNVAHQVDVDGHWYMFRPSLSGAELVAFETTAPGVVVQPPAAVLPGLPPGTIAPDFTVQNPDGKPLSLSEFKGKVVILDFWATWCGPCQQSMPGLEKLYQQIKDQNVVVLSVCVKDQKPAFDKWMADHAGKDYNFTFAFDPAGKGEGEISGSKYNVQGIPFQFVIAPDGKVVGTNMGYNGNENKLIELLKDAGVTVKKN
jgi:thiol-disulfide isomerase/thioredoxin